MKLGPTGRFPQGKAGNDDDGELAIAIAADHRASIVRIDFGTPTAWIGLPASQARGLAALLIEKANELDRRRS